MFELSVLCRESQISSQSGARVSEATKNGPADHWDLLPRSVPISNGSDGEIVRFGPYCRPEEPDGQSGDSPGIALTDASAARA